MRRLWIVAYDISAPQRWRRVFRLLKSWGSPVQYSVFACRLRDGELERLLRELAGVIEATEDRVHVWPVCGQCEARVRTLGRGGRPEPLPSAWIVSEE